MVFQTCCAAVICLCSLLSGQLTSFKILDSCDELLERATAGPRQYQCRRPLWLFPSHCPPHPAGAGFASMLLSASKHHFGFTALSWEPPKLRSFTGVFSSWKESLPRGRANHIRILPFLSPEFSFALILSWHEAGSKGRAPCNDSSIEKGTAIMPTTILIIYPTRWMQESRS